jgi:hypothetical protein
LPQQLIEHRLEQLPRAVLIGVAQGGTFRRGTQSQMLEFALTTEQSLDNLAQTFGLGQLTKQHRDELIPTGKPLGALLGAQRFGGGGKLVATDER